IFAQRGEAAFRKAEAAALNDFLNSTKQTAVVLALGGGAFAGDVNREVLSRANARVVFLAASSSELWRRCTLEKKARPLLGDERHFEQLLTERLPAYQRADLAV